MVRCWKIWYPWSDHQPTYWHLNSIVIYWYLLNNMLDEYTGEYSSWLRTEMLTESSESCCQISKTFETIILGWELCTLHHQSITFWGLVNAILNWKQAIPQTPHTLWWLNCAISWQVQNVLSLKPPSLMLEPPIVMVQAWIPFEYIQIIKDMFQIWWYLVLAVTIMWWKTLNLLIAPHKKTWLNNVKHG